jgi:peptidoglycan/LPS O-acetylase OafA/YrhL
MQTSSDLAQPLPLEPRPTAAGRIDTGFLDGLRGLAALYVLFHHCSMYLMSYGYGGQKEHGFDKLVLYSIKLWLHAHVGVLFFFVLSGFVIHLRYARELAKSAETAKFGWGSYMWRRARRLYPPLIFAIALTAGVDYLGKHVMGFPVYQETPGMRHVVLSSVMDLRTLVGNLLFLNDLPGTGIESWGTDSPLWSLPMEWWFYCMFPVFWVLARRSIKAATAGTVLLYVASFPMMLHPWLGAPARVFQMFPIWFLGVLLAEVVAGRLRFSLAKIAMLTPLIGLGIYGREAMGAIVRKAVTGTFAGQSIPNLIGREIVEIGTGLGIAGIVALLLELSRRGYALWVLKKLKPLGDMSYTLYIVHMPIVAFVSGWLLQQSPQRRLPHSFWPFLLTSIGCLLLAWVAHFFVEKPFVGRGKGPKKSASPAETTPPLAPAATSAT